MLKIHVYNAHDIRPERRGSKVTRLACIIAVGLVLVVPLAEGVSVCIGQWCEVMGRNTEVQTPVLDSVNDGVQATHQSAGNWLAVQFQRLPWNTNYVLPIAAVVTVLGILMLKR